nr:unnamed protein product [Callosobruchus analis]
MEIKTPVVLYN